MFAARLWRTLLTALSTALPTARPVSPHMTSMALFWRRTWCMRNRCALPGHVISRLSTRLDSPLGLPKQAQRSQAHLCFKIVVLREHPNQIRLDWMHCCRWVHWDIYGACSATVRASHGQSSFIDGYIYFTYVFRVYLTSLFNQLVVIYKLCSILDTSWGYVRLRRESSFIINDFFYNKQSILQFFYYFQYKHVY